MKFIKIIINSPTIIKVVILGITFAIINFFWPRQKHNMLSPPTAQSLIKDIKGSNFEDVSNERLLRVCHGNFRFETLLFVSYFKADEVFVSENSSNLFSVHFLNKESVIGTYSGRYVPRHLISQLLSSQMSYRIMKWKTIKTNNYCFAVLESIKVPTTKEIDSYHFSREN